MQPREPAPRARREAHLLLEQLLQTALADADRRRRLAQRMPTTRFRDQLRRLYRGHRSGRLKSRIGLRQPLPEHGAQHRNPRGVVTRFCHAFAQFGALAAPELIEVHRGAGNLAGGRLLLLGRRRAGASGI